MRAPEGPSPPERAPTRKYEVESLMRSNIPFRGLGEALSAGGDHYFVTAAKARPKAPRRSPTEILPGEKFSSRKEIAVALGGTGWRGIDYLASTRHAVLVASSADNDTYKDAWDADQETFSYHGEWHGCDDMRFRGGNIALLRRSGLLMLFVRDPDGYRFVGRFECVGHRLESQRRKECGHEHRAIAFSLRAIPTDMAGPLASVAEAQTAAEARPAEIRSFTTATTSTQALEQLARLIAGPESGRLGRSDARDSLNEAAKVLGIAIEQGSTPSQVAEALVTAGGIVWDRSCESSSGSPESSTPTLEGLNRVVGAALALRTAPAGSKQQALERIAALIGRPARRVSTGSTEPREAFVDVLDALRLPIDRTLPKQRLAEAIARLGDGPWDNRSDSRSTRSGGGGTVTLLGLNRVLRAVGKLVAGYVPD